jgi:type IV pilus assembly protein PilQ
MQLLALAGVLWTGLAAAGGDRVSAQVAGEAKISLDFKEADVRDVVGLLSEVAGFQVIFDPGISCRLTLKLHQVRWPIALDLSLRSCGLGRDEQDGVLRVAPVSRLAEEERAQRAYEDEKARSRPHTVSSFRLSYARAQDLAPLLKKYLSPRGDILYDARTNTLIIVD